MLSKFKETLSAQIRQELTEEIKRELQRTSTLEKEAAVVVAANWKQEAESLKTDAVGLRRQVARLTYRCQKLFARRAWLSRKRELASTASASPGVLNCAPDARDATIERLVLQVNALREENVLFNQLRFRCRVCK